MSFGFPAADFKRRRPQSLLLRYDQGTSELVETLACFDSVLQVTAAWFLLSLFMSLRVISGQYRRRILKTPSDDSTRPYTDRVRQMTFDRLASLLPGARVADVFAGVGTMGVESLSRGAHSCVFFEGGPEIHELLVQNVRSIAPEARTICWKTDVRRTSFRPHGGEDFLPFTLIFFDPPYRNADEIAPGKPLWNSLKRLARPNISTDDCVLVLRTPEHFDEPELSGWKVHDLWEISSMMIWIMVKPGAWEDQSPADDETDSIASGELDPEDENDLDADNDADSEVK